MDKLKSLFSKFSDKLEAYLAHPFGFVLYTVFFILGLVFVGVDATNIVISYVTAGMLFLGLGNARRDRKAVHAKLDDIDPRDEMTRIEEKAEEEIERLRCERKEREAE